jgi:hypothetical protein
MSDPAWERLSLPDVGPVERCLVYGMPVDYARTGGGNPPGVGGMQTNVSCAWWRVNEGPWWRLPGHSRTTRKADLPALVELLVEAGVVTVPVVFIP